MARVAALQFASSTDLEQNLATCLRMIDQAQEHKPQLLVLPEAVSLLASRWWPWPPAGASRAGPLARGVRCAGCQPSCGDGTSNVHVAGN